VNVRTTTAGGPEEDRLGKLERLAQLKESGTLSEEEFEALKAEILKQE
jgi:hypothetical protein